MRKLFFIIVMTITCVQMHAQGDVEYRMEIGGGLGLLTYLGDYNSNFIKGVQPMASVVMRRLFNPYQGLKLNVSYGKLKGSSKNVKTYYPDMADTPYEFNNSIVDFGVVYEYNFWPYGTGREYRGAKRLVPFVFGGIGGTYAHTSHKDVFTANVPLGVGVKYKLADRMNLGVEWSVHFSMSDKLDGSEDPYYVKSSGLFKNTDCYTALQVTLTYSFMAKCRTCHNDDE